MKFTTLIGFKLFLIIFVVMIIGITIFTSLSLKLQEKQYLLNSKNWGIQASDIIEKSMHYSMLQNNRKNIYQIITTIGGEKSIEQIRIYNKKGEITFSTLNKEIKSKVNMNYEACNACHINGHIYDISKTKVAGNNELIRIFNSPKGYRVMGVITPIYNENSCYTSECHYHDKTQTVLGVLDVILPLKNLDLNMVEQRNIQIVGSAILFLLLVTFTGLFIRKMVYIPVKRLTEGTEEIIKGNLDYKINVNTKNEIAKLSHSFNHMTSELKTARATINEWTRTLESRIEEKTKELKNTQAHLINMEKMASLGKLATTVAHELNNPLAGILVYSKLIKKKVSSLLENNPIKKETLEELSIIAKESARCGAIVKNLLLFSKQKIGEYKREAIQDVIKQSISIIEHHFKMNSINMEIEMPEEPIYVNCDRQQIEQALLNIELNAVEAMKDGGLIKISLKVNPEKHIALIEIIDTGIGISEEDLPHIFEPFYTTKTNSSATGLGLAVVYGIIKRHNGDIQITSKQNKGTIFSIILNTC